MRFGLEHSPDKMRVTGLSVVFEEADIPQLRRMIDLLDGGGKMPLPQPYQPLYAELGKDPSTMYAKDPPREDIAGVSSPKEILDRISKTPKLYPILPGSKRAEGQGGDEGSHEEPNAPTAPGHCNETANKVGSVNK